MCAYVVEEQLLRAVDWHDGAGLMAPSLPLLGQAKYLHNIQGLKVVS